METLINILMLLVGFSFVLKLTGYKMRTRLIVLAISAVFTGLGWHFAVEQSRTVFFEHMADKDFLLDMAVLLTIDVVLQMAYCLMAANLMGSGRLKRRTIAIYRLLRLFPGILIFAVLLYLVTACIFAFPGVPFARVSWLCAAGATLLLFGLSLAIDKLLPEKELRLELLFLSNALTAALGVIATVNGRTAMRSVDSPDYLANLGVLAVLLAFSAIGWLLYRFKLKRL